jgi:Protein of unknown function (DUF3039)
MPHASQPVRVSTPTGTTETLTQPDTNLDSTDPRDCAHIVDQRDPANDVTTAMIEGREVTALCGYRWIPYREPKGRPVCEPCVEAYGRIQRG